LYNYNITVKYILVRLELLFWVTTKKIKMIYLRISGLYFILNTSNKTHWQDDNNNIHNKNIKFVSTLLNWWFKVLKLYEIILIEKIAFLIQKLISFAVDSFKFPDSIYISDIFKCFCKKLIFRDFFHWNLNRTNIKPTMAWIMNLTFFLIANLRSFHLHKKSYLKK